MKKIKFSRELKGLLQDELYKLIFLKLKSTVVNHCLERGLVENTCFLSL